MKLFLTMVLLCSVSKSINAHEMSDDYNETSSVEHSMISLPIHIGLDGSISFDIGLMDHGAHHRGHGGVNHGNMNHSGTNHGGMNNGGMNNGGMDHGGMNNGGMDHGGMNNGGMDHGGMNNGGMDHGGMNNEEMNHDNMNHDQMDNNEDHSNHSSTSHDKKWHLAVMPMLHLGGDYYKRIISLSKTKNKAFELSDPSDGYILVENKTIQVGGGLMLMAMAPVNWGAFAHVGAMPYKGGHVFRAKKTHYPHHENLSEMNTPLNLDDLNKWSITDKLSYSTQGGIMFSAGVGVTILTDLSVSYMAQGTWTTSIIKVGKTKALVSIKKNNMKMFMGNIGTIITHLQLHQFNNADKNFNFIFDLKSRAGLKAYLDMVRGNISSAQMLVAAGNKSVKAVSTSESKSFGRMKSFSYGVPFLFKKTKMAGTTFSESYTENYMNNSTMNMDMSMYMRNNKTSGYQSSHMDTGFMFMAGSHSMTINNRTTSANTGSFKWYFQNETSSPAYIRSRFNRAVSILGLDQLNNIRLDHLPRRLNFVRGEIDIALNPKTINSLVGLTRNQNLYNNMYNSAYNKMNAFFAIPGNYKKICPLKRQRFTFCKKRIYKRTWNAISAIPRTLNNIKNSMNNKKEFTKHMAKLGQLALSNRFVFNELFRQLGEKPKAKVKLMGSKIKTAQFTL